MSGDGASVDLPHPTDYLRPMPLRPLLIVPDPVLRQASAPVERIDAEVLSLADDMLATMYDAPGIGLAAVQVGVPRRMVVIDLGRSDEERDPHVFINPRVVWSSDERSVYEEGCLSIPEYYAEVERPARVRVEYLDPKGAERSIEADGLMATCLQHEIDHLDGVLFLDYLSKLKRDMVIRKFAKAARQLDEDGNPMRPSFERKPRPRQPPRIVGAPEAGPEAAA